MADYQPGSGSKPAVRPRMIATLEDSVGSLAKELLDGFASRGEADVYERYCNPLPRPSFCSSWVCLTAMSASCKPYERRRTTWLAATRISAPARREPLRDARCEQRRPDGVRALDPSG